MNVTELASVLQEGPEAAQFIDVREPGEHAIAQLPHFELLPLSRSNSDTLLSPFLRSLWYTTRAMMLN